MPDSRLNQWLAATPLCLLAAVLLWQQPTQAAEAQSAGLGNDSCLGCHGNPALAASGAGAKPGRMVVKPDKFAKSVHGKRSCTECHKEASAVPHTAGTTKRVNCVNCHDALWKAARAANKAPQSAGLGLVVRQIDSYMKSAHALPNRQDPSRANASCFDCHGAHSIYPIGSVEHDAWRLSVPLACGKCHPKESELYATSVHGKAVLNASATS